MARLVSFAHAVEPPLLLDRPLPGGRVDPLAEDRISFDAWLLPPEAPDRAERVIRLCSAAAGPVAFVAALSWFVSQIA